jgi:predicted glycosyltransferase
MRFANRLTEPAAAAEARTANRRHARRFLFYSHDGLGLGHLRRNLSVATALAELDPEASILLATSAEEAQCFPLPPTVDILKLPGLRKIANGRYAARRLNVTWRHVRAVRLSLLLAAVDSFRPSVLLADKHALGIGKELEPALKAMRAAGGRAVLGLRDVLDEPAAVREELSGHGLFERIAEYYDRVLVYGQPDILDASREYGFPEEVRRMTSFCGYVVDAAANRSQENGNAASVHQPPRVLATAGGGEDGFALLAAFVEAAAHAGWDAGVVSGPQCSPEDARRLNALASRVGVAFRRFVPDLSSEFASLDALVCMGGYNTLTEAAACGVSTVCVPRVQPRSEQLIRAEAFARRGLLTLVDPRRLDPAVLGAEVEWALARQMPGRSVTHNLDLNGAWRAASVLRKLASEASSPRAWPRSRVATEWMRRTVRGTGLQAARGGRR